MTIIYRKMNPPINVEESLPIQVLQKDFKITEEEVRTHPTLKLTVIYYLYNRNIFIRKFLGIYFQIKHSL